MMTKYHYALRNQLVSYQTEIAHAALADFASMVFQSNAILQQYQEHPEESRAARANFYQLLYQINENYYQRYLKERSSAKSKILGFFGSRPQPEKQFLKFQTHLKLMIKRATNTADMLWHEDWEISLAANIMDVTRGDPKKYLHGIDAAANHGWRLRLYSHRLMRDENFRDEKYEHFHGLPFELSAYKLKRDIEKFQALYSRTLSLPQNSNITECIHAIDRFLKIKKMMDYSQFLFMNNVVEDHAQNKQYFNRRYHDICFYVYTQLHQLQPGERFLVPHGFAVKDDRGHAALVEFERQNDGKFKISFINTGYGVEDQQRGLWRNLKLMFLGSLNISYVDNISYETILDKNLIDKILDPEVNPKETLEGAAKAMNAAIHCFGDELKQTEHGINLQVNGTCAFSCWLEWLGWRLDPGLYRALDVFINERALQKLQRFYQHPAVPLDLKNGIPELSKAGQTLVEKNRRELEAWLDGCRGHANWESIRKIAATMGVKVADIKRLLLSDMQSINDGATRMIEDYWAGGDDIEDNSHADQIQSFGLFGKVAVGATLVVAAATVYSQIM